jgi:hypothetical protein
MLKTLSKAEGYGENFLTKYIEKVSQLWNFFLMASPNTEKSKCSPKAMVKFSWPNT